MRWLPVIFAVLISENAFALYTETIPNMCGAVGDKMIAIFSVNQHTCAPGYYLPANIDECTKCPIDNYCPGGTYTFNESNSSGISPCPTAHPYAPVGMWVATQCGRKLHIGDDVMYLHQMPATPTEHRFTVEYNGTKYSVNTVRRDDSVTLPKMSAGATHELHIMMPDDTGVPTEYIAHDDSGE